MIGQHCRWCLFCSIPDRRARLGMAEQSVIAGPPAVGKEGISPLCPPETFYILPDFSYPKIPCFAARNGAIGARLARVIGTANAGSDEIDRWSLGKIAPFVLYPIVRPR